MMKHILLIFLVLASFVANSQTTRPAGFPSQFTTGWHKLGYVEADSGLIFRPRDTASFLPRFTGTVVLDPLTRRPYFYDSTDLRWYKFLFTGDVAGVLVSNGLSKDGDTVQLGGTLTESTTISGNSSHGITFSDLTLFNIVNGSGAVTSDWSQIIGTQSITLRAHQDAVGIDQIVSVGQTNGLISLATLGTQSASDLEIIIDTVNRLRILGPLPQSVSSGDSVLVRNSSNQIVLRPQSEIAGGGTNNQNLGLGHRWLVPASQGIKTVFNSNTILWDSTSNANGLTGKVDTSVIATQFDLLQYNQNIQQVLTVGDTTSIDIIWRPTAQPEQIFTATWVPSNFGTVYPGFGEASLFNSGWGRFNGVNASGRPNVVANILTYNAPMGGGRINTNEASYRFGAETHFETGGQQLFEIHFPEIYTLAGLGLRPASLYINKVTGATQLNYLATAGVQYSDITGDPQFSFNVNGNYAFVGRPGSAQITLYDDSTTGARYQMLLTPGSGMGHNTFGLQHIWDARHTFANIFDNSPNVTVTDSRNTNDVTSIFVNATSTNSKNVFSATGSVTVGMISKLQNTNAAGTASYQVISNSGSSTIGAMGMFNSSAASFGAIVANSPYLLGSSASPYVMMNNNAAGTIVFATGGTAERARFNSSGSFGIGTGATVDRLFHAELSDAVTNAVSNISRATHITSGTAAIGFGIGHEDELENASGTNIVASRRSIVWTDATNASEDADYILSPVRAGTITEGFRLFSTGGGRFSGGLFLGVLSNGAAGTDSVLVIANTEVKKVSATTLIGNTLYTGNGTLSGARTVSGASNSLTFGTTGSPVSSLQVNSSDDIRLKGGIVLQEVRANDANYTVLETDLAVRLPAITADRTITINFPIVDTGKVLTIINGNASAFRWNIGTGTLIAASGRTLDFFEPSTNYTIQLVGVDGGSAEWRVLGVQGYPVPRVSSSGTVTLEASVHSVAEYVATGTTATYTLPTPATTLIGFTFSIKNRGSNNVTVDVNGGGSTIYDASAVASVIIAAGESRSFTYDGAFYNTN